MRGLAAGSSRVAASLALACYIASPAAALNVTVSGQSAGGSMAMQHLFAFSSQVQGAAIAAGSAYGCGAFPEGHYPQAKCYTGGINVSKTLAWIQQRFRDGLIDDPANLRRMPIVLFGGTNDWVVYTQCMQDVATQLQEFVEPEVLEIKFNLPATHVWSVDHGVCTCGLASYLECAVMKTGLCCDVNNCNYDLSGDMLSRFYGPIFPRKQARGYFHWIYQPPYIPPPAPTWSGARMELWALAYVPTGCLQDPGSCRVHVSYHGCMAVEWPERLRWSSEMDLNEYGEANNIITLYPQAIGDNITGSGCWNWGFTKDDQLFDTKKSVQLATVQNILNDLPRAIRQAVQLPSDQGPPPKPGAGSPAAAERARRQRLGAHGWAALAGAPSSAGVATHEAAVVV